MKKILFCIPYAGSSAMGYIRWRQHLKDGIEVVPLELAGRGTRLHDGFYKSFEEAVEDLLLKVKRQPCEAYGIFGHSMGSWLALELAYKLEEYGLPPERLFISGNWPPHMQRIEPELHQLSDDLFKEEILKVGGTPKELLEQKELLDFFLPILRADYRILERYQGPKVLKKLKIPLTVFNGTLDDVTKEELEGWRVYTDQECDIHHIQGNHFFVNENIEGVTTLLNQYF